MQARFNFLFSWGLTAVLFFISLNTLKSQQKIQIKDGTASKGHFFVELLHNKPGAPMVSFTGEGGKINVDKKQNKFILRMQNFIWYNPDEEVELSFNLDQVNAMGDPVLSFDQEEKTVTLKPVSSYIRDIQLNVDGIGKVKLSLPFSYEGGDGRFMQEFDIILGALEEEKKELNSRDIRALWNEVNKEDEKEVVAFIKRFESSKTGKRYLKSARNVLEDIKGKQLLENEKNKRKEIVSAYESRKNAVETKSDDPEEEPSKELDSEKLLDDIEKTVENLDLGEAEGVKQDLFHNLSLFYNSNQKDLKVHESEMPLQITLKELGAQDMHLINALSIPTFYKDSMVTIEKELVEANNIRGEFSSFTLVNAQGIELYSDTLELVNVKGSESRTMGYILGLAGLLGLLGIFLFFSRRAKQKKVQETKKVLQQRMEANRELAKNETPSTSNNKVGQSKGKIVIGAKTRKTSESALTPVGSVPRKTGSGRIKITKKKTSGIPIPLEDFRNLVKTTKTVNIDLQDIWQDSKIGKVYLGKTFIKELDHFLAESSNEGIQNELQGAVPEVGGFMMGRFADNTEHIEIMVEKFVPFVPEYNDVFKIEIGTKTIVDELGDAQDKNPDLDVIGWFHTHPGHGLFLSTSDLSVQRHFAMDHQVAMEIDSLTPGLDMSIFTRKSSGAMNNSVDRKEGVGWFRWVDIENSKD